MGALFSTPARTVISVASLALLGLSLALLAISYSGKPSVPPLGPERAGAAENERTGARSPDTEGPDKQPKDSAEPSAEPSGAQAGATSSAGLGAPQSAAPAEGPREDAPGTTTEGSAKPAGDGENEGESEAPETETPPAALGDSLDQPPDPVRPDESGMGNGGPAPNEAAASDRSPHSDEDGSSHGSSVDGGSEDGSSEDGYAPSVRDGASAGGPEPRGGYGSDGGPDEKTLTLSVEGMARVQEVEVKTAQMTDTEALDAGPVRVEGTGLPWEEGSNTYIAGHRIGYPGTASDRVFWDLGEVEKGATLTLADSDGKLYRYRVYANFVADPSDTHLLQPVEGKEIVTLQTCTLPDYSERIIVRAERIE